MEPETWIKITTRRALLYHRGVTCLFSLLKTREQSGYDILEAIPPTLQQYSELGSEIIHRY